MIDVRMYAALVGTSRSSEFEVEATPDLTVRDVVVQAGIRFEDVAIVMVNGQTATLDSPLSDNDRVGLFPVVSGG
jgi:molybdopterin converting factor small subunit